MESNLAKDGRIDTIEHIKAALTVAPVGMTILDTTLNEIIFANDTAVASFGFKSDTLTRANLTAGGYVAVDLDGRPLALTELATSIAVATGEPQKRITGMMDKAGGVRWYDVKAQPAVLDDGRHIVITAFADITEVMAAHNERAELAELQSNAIANLSHELRTPLNLILGYTELIRSGAIKPDGIDRALEIVYKSAKEMQWMAETMLWMAKLESGSPIDLEPVDLAAVVRYRVEAMQIEAEKNKTLLVCEFMTPCWVMGHEILLSLAIGNLIANAIKFSPGGTVYVHMEGTAVTVTDTGIGMTPETQAIIFQKFRQGDGGNNRRYRGTGVGLHFVDLVAKFHGGRVDVVSELGVGSVFSLVLPLGGE